MKALVALIYCLLASCSVPPPPVTVVPKTPSTIVIVHGLFANAEHVRPLTNALEAQGYTCLTPDLHPNDGSLSIEEQAEQLSSFLKERLSSNAPLQFIGHSMGGLVALQLLQQSASAKRCRGLYTITTPHQGTFLASLHRGVAGQQMTRNASFLKRLHSRRPDFPVTTYRSTTDIVIIPNSSATLPFADNLLIQSSSHNAILNSVELHQDLIQRLQRSDAVR